MAADPNDEVTVRAAAVDDWRAVRAVRLAALAEAPHAFASTLAREQAFPDDEWRRRVGPGNWVLALVRDESVGVAAGIAETLADPAADAGPDERHVVAMWVAPGFRGRGIAAALVAGVARWAGGEGAGRLSLWVVDGNDRARRSYERMGFRTTGRRQPLPGADQVWEERFAVDVVDLRR